VHGVGRSNGAITVVNALPTGIGAAIGVDLPVVAEVELHPAGSHGKWDVRVADAARTPLVIASLTESLRRFAPDSSGRGELTLRSEVPAGRGLKSSSAVGTAIALAVARATDAASTPSEIARTSARAAVAAGVSATGAFDDALAGVSGGIVVTDNPRGELLRTIPVRDDWRVALFVPDEVHRPSPEWLAAFRAESAAGRAAAEAAVAGDWIRAMRLNSLLVENVVGYAYGPVRDELERRGAIAAGVSGLGPTLAAVVPADRMEEVTAALPTPAKLRRIVGWAKAADPGSSRSP
jgi:shikimate kinase